MRRLGLSIASAAGALTLAACAAGANRATVSTNRDSLAIVAEGPCARLSIQTVGQTRLVVFGDTGYDLELWAPGEEIAAAQAIAELRDGAAYFDDRWTRGLELDARGYVPASLELGGSTERSAWARVTRSRYAPHGTGKLFVREATAFARAGDHWEPLAEDSGAALPPAARGLPALTSASACSAGLRFLPLTHEVTPAGGMVIAGRCQGDTITPSPDTTLVVLHGRPGANRWEAHKSSPRARLEGHVNADLYARAEDDVYLAAYEPFEPVAGRQAFLAHWDGATWTEIEAGIDGGIMSIAGTPDGELFLATGGAVLRRDRSGKATRIALPAPTFVEPGAQLHVHTVRFAGGELWVEAALKIGRSAPAGSATEEVWGSVLYGPSAYGHYHCDARERADDAFFQAP